MRKKSSKKTKRIRGVLRLHARGFGFVQPEASSGVKETVFIPKQQTKNGVDGDVVEVELTQALRPEKGPEGIITAIVERARKHVLGIVEKAGGRGEIEVYAPTLGQSHRVRLQPVKERRLRRGDRMMMEVVTWGEKGRATLCKMTHYIGPISDPSLDVEAAVAQFELPSAFSAEAIQEAERFGSSIPEEERKRREDLRAMECVTIDPKGAEDFDDALSLTKDKKGNYLLGVHIADVSYYVSPDSVLDKEARIRANSTYLPGSCVPMLPHALSNQLCSLRPNVDRLAVSLLVELDSSGNVVKERIARSVIKSRKRFTYEEAKAILDGKEESSHCALLERMVELCLLLKSKRIERGSLELAIPDVMVVLDEGGAPCGTERVEYDITHQMVEEFMLKANELVAHRLDREGKLLPYRIHEEPTEESLREFSALADLFGFSLSATPSPKELQAFFQEAMKTPYADYLMVSYVKRMRLAVYSPENIGHYGLGLSHYSHFTSPIRRYIDLIVHRTLFGEAESLEAIEETAQSCSEKERIAEKAERQVILLKKLRLLKKMADKPLEAVITRVQPFGLSFELIDLMLEGFLHVSELGDDFYEFDDKAHELIGSSTGNELIAGEKIWVMIKEVDLIHLESRWRLFEKKRRAKKRRRG